MNGNSGKTKTIIWVTLLLLVVVLGIGYAAISTIQLRIEGSASADPNQTNFKVEFTGSPTVSTPSNVEATINPSNKLLATMNVTGLHQKSYRFPHSRTDAAHCTMPHVLHCSDKRLS